ncbi:MAG: TolB family protein, partial [Daejeonella sp.]
MKYIIIFKILFISIITVIILTISVHNGYAQIFDSEQAPPSVKWMQVNTENFQILYPSEFKVEAMRMANTLERLVENVSKTLGKSPRKITVILQNQGVIPNGFVQLAPRRSEFFTTPPQNFDIQDWLNSLAVHELRHVVQLDKLTGNLKAPFFEGLALAIFGVTLPPWFFEGDAVGIETSLSPGGRGRLPDWELFFRTNTLSRPKYSYSKDYFGSFKDRTPGYYQLGYFMTSKLRRDYGKGIIDSVMTRISRNPFRPYSLSSAIKKLTGLTTRNLHDSTVTELGRLWKDQIQSINSTEYMPLNIRPEKTPADYLFPVKVKSGEIVVLKTGFAQTPALVRISPSGEENKILKIGYQTESNFKYSSGKLVWDEFRYDVRFQKRSYNVINLYNMADGEYKQLTHKSRLFSPALSPDGQTIAAVKVSLVNKFELVEIDAESGKELRAFSNPRNYILQTPSYSDDGKRIISVAITQDGAALVEFNSSSGANTTILPFQRQQLSRPVYAGNRIIFRAHYNGINNLYSLIPGSGIKELTAAIYGASNPSYGKESNTILFNNYKVKGYDISSLPLDQGSEIPVSLVRNTFINYSAPLVVQESASKLFDSIPEENYPVKPYREVNNLFYFHSLSPIAENPLNDDLKIGLKLNSNNKLNTLDFYTGYQYNSALKKSEYLAGFSYKRFFPILDLNYINRARLAFSRRVSGGVTTVIPVNWRENFVQMEVRVPLVFNRLNKTFAMGFSGSSTYTSRYEIINRPSVFAEKIRFPLTYQVYLNHNFQRSARDLAPRWGQNITVSYQSLPFEKSLSGDLFRV